MTYVITTLSLHRYNPIVVSDFVKNILDPIYGTMDLATLHTLDPHRLSVFFVLLATGLLFDGDGPSARVLAEQFYALSRAAFVLDSVLVNATSSAVQALFMMFRYIHVRDQSNNQSTWILTGLCCRLAQTVRAFPPLCFITNSRHLSDRLG
jgi:hypothetical protein